MRAHALRVVALSLLAVSPASAQSAQDILGRYVGGNAQGYLGPLADYLGAALNSGWTHSAGVPAGFAFPPRLSRNDSPESARAPVSGS